MEQSVQSLPGWVWLEIAAKWIGELMNHLPPGTGKIVEAATPEIMQAEHALTVAMLGDNPQDAEIKALCREWMLAYQAGVKRWREHQAASRAGRVSGLV